jgi:predicted ABC-type ATPase
MVAPEAILIAGANGSGKTTFARQVLPLLHPAVPFLNADEIRHEDPRFQSDVAATRELLRRLQVAESSGNSFAGETTLSSRSYVAKVRHWTASGYRVVLHFIAVPSSDFAVQRVATRVAMGATASRNKTFVDGSNVAAGCLMRYTGSRYPSGISGSAIRTD